MYLIHEKVQVGLLLDISRNLDLVRNKWNYVCNRTRAKKNLMVRTNLLTKSVSQYTYFYHGPKSLNKRPLKMRQVNNLKTFEKLVKEYSFENETEITKIIN